jgi:hypothetical protein
MLVSGASLSLFAMRHRIRHSTTGAEAAARRFAGPKYAATERTPDKAKAAITGYTAYFGTYTIDESARTVTHHRIGNIDPSAPADVVRRYEFGPGDWLILMPVEDPTTQLTWERIK